MEWFVFISIIALFLGLLFSVIRLLKGPTIFDRILCFDGIAVSAIGILLIGCIVWKTTVFIDVILLYSIFGFFGTMAFSYYLYLTYDDSNNHATMIPDTTVETETTPS